MVEYLQISSNIFEYLRGSWNINDYQRLLKFTIGTPCRYKNYFKSYCPSALRASVLNVPHEIISKEFSIFSGVAVAKAGPLRAERKCPFPKAVLVPRLTPTFWTITTAVAKEQQNFCKEWKCWPRKKNFAHLKMKRARGFFQLENMQDFNQFNFFVLSEWPRYHWGCKRP